MNANEINKIFWQRLKLLYEKIKKYHNNLGLKYTTATFAKDFNLKPRIIKRGFLKQGNISQTVIINLTIKKVSLDFLFGLTNKLTYKVKISIYAQKLRETKKINSLKAIKEEKELYQKINEKFRERSINEI